MIKPGDIGFVFHNNNFISKAIAWFMQSKWSHSFMAIESGDFEDYLCETTDFEVAIGGLTKYVFDKNCRVQIFRPDPEIASEQVKKTAVQNSLATVGSVYGYLQLISLGLRRLLMRVGIRIHNVIRLDFVCDEVVLEGARLYDIQGLRNIDPKSIDTQELYEIVSGSKYFKLVLYKEVGESMTRQSQ